MIVIVMGVVGAGKTTVGSLLAKELGWDFADADDFHPKSNVEKMSRGIPLTDADRLPWLETLRQQIKAWIAAQKNVVLACSALKRTYRQMLGADSAVKFVYLKGRAALIAERLRHRHGHFTGESILASQMTDLQEPETAVVVDIRRTPSEIVDSIRKQLALE